MNTSKNGGHAARGLADYDDDALARTVTALAPVWRGWLRARVDGIDAVPAEGPLVVVANHSIGTPWEVAALLAAWRGRFGAARPVAALTDDVWFNMPGMAPRLRRLGFVPATEAEADAVLGAGGALLVFPGGTREAARPWWRWRRAQLRGRLGWARLAARHGARVVPVSILGAHLSNPVLVQSRALAWISGSWMFGVKWMPLTVGQALVGVAVGAALAPWAGPWWALVAAWAACWNPLSAYLPVLPMPIRIRVQAPVAAPDGDAHATLSAYYDRVAAAIQAGLDLGYADAVPTEG